MIFPMEIDNSDKLQIRRSMIKSSSSCILQLMRKVPELFFRKTLMQLKADDIRGKIKKTYYQRLCIKMILIKLNWIAKKILKVLFKFLALEKTSQAMRKHYATHFIWSKFLKGKKFFVINFSKKF